MDPLANQVTYQSLPANPPNTMTTNPIVTVVKTVFESIALFFSRLAYGLYNAIQLHHLGSKLSAGKSVTTCNDARSAIYYMFQKYTTNDPNYTNFNIHQRLTLDINRSYIRAEALQGRKVNLDAFIDVLAQIAGSREGVHMISRILHQGLLVTTGIADKHYQGLQPLNLIPQQNSSVDATPCFTVQKVGTNVVFIAGVIWKNIDANNIEEHTIKNHSYVIQKVIVPASKIGNIQSPLDFKTEEYYSPLFADEDDAIAQFHQAINYTPPEEVVQSDEESIE